MAQRLVLAVDIDEVLAGFVPALASFYNERYATSSDLKLDATSFVSYEFHKVWGGTAAECSDIMTAFFESAHFLEGVRPIPGALESLTQLRAELPGIELHCVTARQNKLEMHTRAWVEAHYPGLFTDIHFGNHYSTTGVSRSKPDMCRAICAFALVDDSVVYARQCAAAGIPVILFGSYAWNSDIDLSVAAHAGRVTRAETWAHAVVTLKSILTAGLPTPPPVSPLLLASYLLPQGGPHYPKVAAVQMCSSHDKAANLAAITRLVDAAATAGAALVCLPEACLSLGRSAAESVELAEPEGGPYFTEICALARRFQVWISFCLAVRDGAENEGGKVRNRHVVVDCLGEVAARYDKVHLFDSPMAGLCESAITTPGEELVSSANTPLGHLGLAVCYDVRFPQLFAALSARGAEVLLVPAAFTVPTGDAHWEVLLRARAIENQAFVVAAAQGGAHHKDAEGGGRVSYGHTMVIDPWGRVLARAEGSNAQREGFVLCTVDMALVDATRNKMPVLQHRRPQVY